MKSGGSLTILTGTIMMITTMMGAGTILMPCAVRELGKYTFIFVFGLISFLSFLTLYMISYVANDFSEANPGKETSYYTVTSKYSRILGSCVDLFLIIQGVGSCIVYTQVVANWFFTLLGLNLSTGKLIISILVFTFMISILASQKSLSALKFLQYVSVSAVLYLLGLCVFYAIVLPSSNEGTNNIVRDNDCKNLYNGISSFVFAISCHQNIVQVYSELKNKSMFSMKLISGLCILVGFSIYSLVGGFGYYLVGNDIGNKPILGFMLQENNNFTERMTKGGRSNWPIKIGGWAFLIVMTGAYPMQMTPVRNGFINLVSLNKSIKKQIHDNMTISRIVISVSFCSLVAGITILTRSSTKAVDTTVGLIAATAGCATVYIIPALLYCMCRKKISPMTVLSAIVCCTGLGLSVYLLFNIIKQNIK